MRPPSPCSTVSSAIPPSRPATGQAAGRSGGQGWSQATVASARRLALDRREHGGTLSAERDGERSMDANDVLALGLGVTPPWKLVGQRLDMTRQPNAASRDRSRPWHPVSLPGVQ